MPDCKNCTKKCPQAELAHNAALGRMYATSELVSIIKRIERGELVEVVRCRDCKFYKKFQSSLLGEVMCCIAQGGMRVYKGAEDFCSLGERKQMTEHMEVRTNE